MMYVQEHVDTHVKLMNWGIKPTIVHSLQRLYDSQAVSRVEEDPFLAIREAGGSYEYGPNPPVTENPTQHSDMCPCFLPWWWGNGMQGHDPTALQALPFAPARQ